jgi:hypothetical protein
MDDERLTNITFNFFEYFVRVVYKHPNFELKRSDLQKTQIKNLFKRRRSKSPIISPGFLFEFLAYQFEYQLKYGKFSVERNRVMLNWITGEKPVKRWWNKPVSYKYYIQKNVLGPYGITKNDIFNYAGVDQENDQVKLLQHEETERGKFYNSIRGLAWCIEATSLYHPGSKWCKDCFNKNPCKILLKDNYPDLAELRGVE